MKLDVTFDVQFTNEAQKHYDSLDANMTRRVNNAINALRQNPFLGPNIKKLKGNHAGKYRYQVGSSRIIYSVDKERQMCTIIGIYSRERAYR
jgi:mRNA interferase RelE/StbE